MAPQDENVQKEVSMEVQADEVTKSGNASRALNSANTIHAYDQITAQLLQGGVQALNQMMMSNVRNMDLAFQQSLKELQRTGIIGDANAGAAADAAIDQSPPDEGIRQAKTE